MKDYNVARLTSGAAKLNALLNLSVFAFVSTLSHNRVPVETVSVLLSDFLGRMLEPAPVEDILVLRNAIAESLENDGLTSQAGVDKLLAVMDGAIIAKQLKSEIGSIDIDS